MFDAIEENHIDILNKNYSREIQKLSKLNKTKITIFIL